MVLSNKSLSVREAFGRQCQPSFSGTAPAATPCQPGASGAARANALQPLPVWLVQMRDSLPVPLPGTRFAPLLTAASEKPFGSLSHAGAQPPRFHKSSKALKLKSVSVEAKVPAVCCSSEGAGVHLLLPRQPGNDTLAAGAGSTGAHLLALDAASGARQASGSKFPPASSSVQPVRGGVGCQHRLSRAFLGQQKLSSWDAEFAKALATSTLNSAPACGGGGMSHVRLRSLHLPRFGVFPLLGRQPKASDKPSEREPRAWASDSRGERPSPQRGGAQFGQQSFQILLLLPAGKS